MTKYFYYNANGEKFEVTGEQIRLLAGQGVITPETIIENEAGRSIPAGKAKGLTFGTPKPQAVHEADELEDRMAGFLGGERLTRRANDYEENQAGLSHDSKWKYQDAKGEWHATSPKNLVNLMASGKVGYSTPVESPRGRKNLAGKLSAQALLKQDDYDIPHVDISLIPKAIDVKIGTYIGWFIVVGFVALLAYAGANIEPETDTPQKQSAPSSTEEWDATRYAKEVVRGQLKSPSSAKFESPLTIQHSVYVSPNRCPG